MIVLPELQDLPEMITLESRANLSAPSDSSSRHSSPFKDSSSARTSSDEKGVGEGDVGVDVPMLAKWEGETINGRLSNICRAPQNSSAGFRFRASLYHEVANGVATIKGYKKLEEMVRQYKIPRTILLLAGTKNERVCTVSRTGWILVYVDHFNAGRHFSLSKLIFDDLAEYELALA
ncbi:hypothetical protein SLEP1_g28719 [Rubroshorea leprosula]|uniref:Uncharacterized protein n=1 Tax=Rubroshorea leprosula TaxID=152421 RepID=A0AAV5K092_9ROSI|nr:hypothetical protein SLEP1_g28719 [Rubroshorea leprosula]